MSEYIFELDNLKLVNEPMQREEIVRCRDCKFYTHNSFPRCDLYSVSHEVEPDGFCAWGERRDA